MASARIPFTSSDEKGVAYDDDGQVCNGTVNYFLPKASHFIADIFCQKIPKLLTDGDSYVPQSSYCGRFSEFFPVPGKNFLSGF